VSGDFNYTVKFQRRRTLVLYVMTDGSVEARVPMGTPEAKVVSFVEARAGWVVKTRARQLERLRWQVAVEPGAQLWLLGEQRRLRLETGGAFAVALAPEEMVVSVRDPFNLPLLARQLDGWYREQAAQKFGERLPACCTLFPQLDAPPPLRLRKMRRRWGSCNRRGVVTLNTELVKLPPSLIDYVIVHELCHLFEFNHGPRFYRLMERALPDWKQREAMLRQF
jgi:predicted metal-dependent hydrolase